MKNLTWQNPEQLFVAQELINKVKSKCCGIKVFDKTTQKTVFASAINEYLKKECINIFRDLNANDFKNSLEKQVLTYTKGNVERSFERILSPTGWGLKEYVPLKKRILI